MRDPALLARVLRLETVLRVAGEAEGFEARRLADLALRPRARGKSGAGSWKVQEARRRCVTAWRAVRADRRLARYWPEAMRSALAHRLCRCGRCGSPHGFGAEGCCSSGCRAARLRMLAVGRACGLWRGNVARILFTGRRMGRSLLW